MLFFFYRSCGLAEDLCYHVKEMQKGQQTVLTSLMSKGLFFSETLQVQKPETPTVPKQEQGEESVLTGQGGGESCDGEGWKPVTFSIRRKAPAPPTALHLQVHCHGSKGLGSLEVSNPAEPEPCSITTRKQQWATFCCRGWRPLSVNLTCCAG